ncbi:Uma2 family endonuclease [Kovacikia minuta CCNUW1]|uniref:Uma2 family endonuclease n=1 Tax=Kovacikia minuta TaxID=2931930 RepID=UPI001CCEA289|nr:Uma2 family endonuclease [Kovacikia minuta]UBF25270.1 Uma2 family endonuclease [Kovacikia minuta CCNUW1]
MVQQYDPFPYFPTEDELPDSDNQPVDNELQLLLPILLRAILLIAWADRPNWFMGANLGLYYHPNDPAIGPDAFLSLGVPRIRPNGKLRLSYVVWQENDVMPQWVLEIVSRKTGGEYSSKFKLYAEMGVLYYTIYNPDHWRRDKHDPFEVYRLIDGSYVRQAGNPIWMPEIGLGIGVERGNHNGYLMDWLYWYNEQGERLPAPENILQQERQRAEQERQRAEQAEQRASIAERQIEQERRLREELLNKLRQRGIDPEEL